MTHAIADDSAPYSINWDNRNSPAAIEATAKEFIGMLAIQDSELQFNNLSRRPELMEVAKLAKANKYPEALAAYERYYLNKLRYPNRYGLSAQDVSPYSTGVQGEGGHPGPFLEPQPDRAKVIANADRLMKHLFLMGDKEVDFGEPGRVNWNFPLAPGEPTPSGKVVPRPLESMASVFAPLVQAFLLTGKEEYLKQWAGYLDDWSLNSRYLGSIHPCVVPDRSAGADDLISFTRQIGALGQAVPADREPLAPVVLARVIRKLMTQQLLAVAYIRSNTHNWTPDAKQLLGALMYDEFRISSVFFREARRRNIEDNAATQNLRDGTENQQCPWYNRAYLDLDAALGLIATRASTLEPWQELPWVAELRGNLLWSRELREHMTERMNYLLHCRTPQNELPSPIRGGPKQPAYGLPGISAYQKVPDRIAPEAYDDPVNAAIVAAIATPKSGVRPPYTDEWFPYGGYNIVREGWEKDSGYGALFCSPKPGAYGGFRSRSNNNTFGMSSFGQDLLVDDNKEGHYMWPSSPITVDGKQQFFHAGIYKVPDPAAHKVYQVSAWTEPADWRWHSSDRFSLMEGVYAGSWADPDKRQPLGRYSAKEASNLSIPLDQTLQGVTHQRLVHYLRGHRLWIVTDRMASDQPHQYEQTWCFPMLPGPYAAFQPEQIKVDAQAHRIFTDATENELSDKQKVKMANVSMQQFTAASLSYSSAEWKFPPLKDGRVFMYGWKKIKTAFQGQGCQQIVTAILPRQPGSGSESEFQGVKQLDGPNGVTGCELKLPDGATVSYLSAPNGDGELALGDLKMRGEALLLDGNSAMALGCRAVALKGKQCSVPAADFEFTLKDGTMADIKPIYRPIDPVRILPESNVFVEEQQITMASRTPGVEIRYTVDGSNPTPQSPLYAGPVTLKTSAMVKARAYRPGIKANPVHLSGVEATVPSMAVFTKSTPLDSVKAPKAQPGLNYSYFEDDWKQLWLFLDELKPKSTGTSAALFDPAIIPADNPPVGEAMAPWARYFAIEYTGYLNVPADGVYTFHAPREYVMPDTDAGYELQLYLGNKTERNRVVGLNQWYPATRLHALGNWSIALQKGLQPFKLVYVDYRTDAATKLNIPGLKDYIWTGVMPDLRISGPGIEKQPIPAEWLRH